jgi:hypothetical protein
MLQNISSQISSKKFLQQKVVDVKRVFNESPLSLGYGSSTSGCSMQFKREMAGTPDTMTTGISGRLTESRGCVNSQKDFSSDLSTCSTATILCSSAVPGIISGN